jgi:iron(III) transport system ATP-binding protein
MSVPRGKVVALLGPSGSGKTTLLRAVAGLETPHTGSIKIGDRTLYDSANGANLPAEKRGLGLVFQSYALWPHRTVFDNVAYGLKLRGVSTEEKKRRVEAALARALVYEPPVILLDEPLSNLDAKLREEARAWLRQLIVALDLSALCVTHDQVEAMAIADKIVLLNGGEIEQEGTPAELYEKPRTLFAAEFMGSNNRLTGTSAGAGKLKIGKEVIEGMARGGIAAGGPATGVIRLEKVKIADGPGSNRLKMELKTQMYLGERFELVFAREKLLVRAYAEKKLADGAHYVEFPRDALWIFPQA